jgi:hypothetical protein
MTTQDYASILLGMCTDGNYSFQETGTIFTHHQKTVIVDADAGNHKRRIVAFVGGLDLCGGRYDTPRHSLFHTLQTFHKEDYYNPNFAVNILSHIRVSTLCNGANRLRTSLS